MLKTDIIIEAQNLSKYYMSGEMKVKAVDEVNLKIERGSFIALVGSSGSGKTTLLNLITGLERPSSGHIIFAGQNITDMKENDLTKLRARRIGFIFQSYNLIPILTALENVELPTVAIGIEREEGRKRAITLLEQVKLGNRMHHKPSELSGGEQQRVAIARALVNNPDVVVADEPTGNLDSSTGTELVNLMKNLNKEKGCTLIVCTHDQLIAKQADERLFMRDGRIIETLKQNNENNLVVDTTKSS